MSRPRVVGALILALSAVIACVSPAAAQSRGTRTDSLRERVRALDSVVAVRGRVVDSIRRSLVRPVPPVVVRRGPLEVRTVAEAESRVRVAVDSVSALIDRSGGPALAARVSKHVPMVIPQSKRAFLGTARMLAIEPDTARRAGLLSRRPVPATASAIQLADGFARLVEEFAVQGADSALGAWVMLGRLPLRPASAEEEADSYVETAMTASAALRRCRAGDALSCLDALGIDSIPGTRLARWYAPDDYRALMAHVAPTRDDSVGAAAWLRCRNDRDEAACTVAANAISNDRIPPPLSASARAMFLREVLAAGGPEAYARLMDASGSIRARFERTSGESIDSTVRRWRERVERARPEAMQLRAGFVLASLGWTGAILGLTLVGRRSWA